MVSEQDLGFPIFWSGRGQVFFLFAWPPWLTPLKLSLVIWHKKWQRSWQGSRPLPMIPRWFQATSGWMDQTMGYGPRLLRYTSLEKTNLDTSMETTPNHQKQTPSFVSGAPRMPWWKVGWSTPWTSPWLWTLFAIQQLRRYETLLPQHTLMEQTPRKYTNSDVVYLDWNKQADL